MEATTSRLCTLLIVVCLCYTRAQDDEQTDVDGLVDRAGQQVDELTSRVIGLSERLTALLEEDAIGEETANRLFSNVDAKEGTSGPCKRGYFPCGAGPFGAVQCVRDYLICDGTASCKNRADESLSVCGKCPADQTTTTHFKSRVGTFLPAWFCCGGKVWTECVSDCTKTCSDQDYFICRVRVKTQQCVSGCQCPSNYPLWHEGQCVDRRECPGSAARFGFEHYDIVIPPMSDTGRESVGRSSGDEEFQCGVPEIEPDVWGRIVGGVEAIPHSWPWITNLRVNGNCGGSLIAPQWVLTAAHCGPRIPNTRGYLPAILGNHDTWKLDDYEVNVRIEKLVRHPNFYFDSDRIPRNDIMLVKLAEPVAMTDGVSPVCLPPKGIDYTTRTECYALGWGATQETGGSSRVLMQLELPMIGRDVCNAWDWYNGDVDETMMCAGFEEGGKDSCQGDSGGPLVCRQGDTDIWELTGLVSWGIGCARQKKPGVYTNVGQFIPWIEEIMAADTRQPGVPAIEPDIWGRIVGGVEAIPHSWPWIANLRISRRGGNCGGSLIRPQWLLTAGHCGGSVMHPGTGRGKTVTLGNHRKSVRNEQYEVKARIEKVIRHKDYNGKTYANDIMLVKLTAPVTLTDGVSLVLLPPNDVDYSGTDCYAAGWGDTKNATQGGKRPDVLMQVDLPLIERHVCNAADWYNGQIDDGMVCAGHAKGGKDACQGDSGGPFVCLRGDTNIWELTGVVSWGIGCAVPKQPGVYANVWKFKPWIEQTIRENS